MRNLRAGHIFTLPNEVGVLHNTRERILTLATCCPFNLYIGSAPKRFIVQARDRLMRYPIPTDTSKSPRCSMHKSQLPAWKARELRFWLWGIITGLNRLRA